MISRDSIWKKKEDTKEDYYMYLKIGKYVKTDTKKGYLVESSDDNLTWNQHEDIVEEEHLKNSYEYTGKCEIPINDRTLLTEDITEIEPITNRLLGVIE